MCADIQIFKNQVKDNNVKKIFNSLNLFQKISLLLISIAVIAGLISLVKWSNKPEFVILYNNLSYSDASNITEKLKESKIQYQLSEDGTTIKVKKADLANARLTLAAQGIPNNSIVGFELFDKQFFGLTDFTQKVNYQRALEGELSRTISELEEVESARVHLVLADDNLFSEQNQNATASVVLKLKNGKTIKDDSVLAIKNLVANAVKNLNPENISIIDTNGNLLTIADANSQSLNEQQKIKSELEKNLEDKISNMLTKLVGQGNSVVSVTAELNTDQKETESETYLPGDNGQGVALQKSVTSESYNKAISDSNTGDKAGTDTNVPIVTQGSNENIPSYGEKTQNSSKESNVYQKNEEQTQFGVSKLSEKIKYSTGDIKKLNIGIFLNSNIPEDKISEIESVIMAAAGIDKSRGDVLSIKRISFANVDSNKLIGEDNTNVPISNKILEISKTALPGGFIVILLLLLTLRSKGFLKKKSLIGEAERKKLIEKIDHELNQLSGNEYDYASKYGDLNSTSDAKAFSSNKEIAENNKSPNFFAARDERLSKEEKRKRIIEIRKKVLEKMDETMYAELKEIVTFESNENPQAAAKAIRNWLANST